MLPAAIALLAGCTALHPPLPSTSVDPHFVPPQQPYKLALVLSSGTLRGFAHFGVLSELRANGIVPDLIVGTSAGAMVGALIASGLTDTELVEVVERMDVNYLRDWTVPRLGLLGGQSLHDFIDRRAKYHVIEEFPIAFAAVAVEAERTCLQVFNAGDPGKAAQASSTVPVILTPPRINGRRYLDGALASPLPVRVARALGAEKIIAVDVTLDPAERHFANILEAYWRTTLVMHRVLAINERADADYTLVPQLPPEFMIKYDMRHQIVESGRDAVRQNLHSIQLAMKAPAKALPRALHPSLASVKCPELQIGEQVSATPTAHVRPAQ
ncbi:MAG: patatin-like phospholipase family protein [Burkholderiales bacterium]|nr:patatin-like phospholipase family protein [Burkholderiales bacterium]